MASSIEKSASQHFVIAIDGPAGAGKSTIAKVVSRTLGFVRIDTGAMYRAVALHVLEAGQDPDDSESCGAIAEALDLHFRNEGEPVLYAGERRLTDALRTTAVAQAASRVSVHPRVRNAMTESQRAMGQSGCVVLEGRDIGTVVFPDADLKIYLTASATVRATRRLAELSAAGGTPTFAAILAEIEERDARDKSRATAPLRAAADAIWVDSSDLEPEAVGEKIVTLARARLA